MLVFRITSLAALIVNLLLGVLVLYTQPRRRANRVFFFSSLLFTTWLVCLVGGSFARDPDRLLLWIRLAGATSPLALVAFDVLSWAVANPLLPWRTLRRRLRIWYGLTLSAVAIALSPWHVTGVTVGASGFAEAVYGLLQGPYVAVWVLSLGTLSLRFVRDIRRSEGIERAELQFLLLAVVSVVVTGVAMAQLGPLFTGRQTLVPWTPLCVIVFDGIIAYGIATRRILSVDALLRRMTAYGLLFAYLALLYAATAAMVDRLLPAPGPGAWHPAAHVLGAFVVMLSLAPANGWMQRFTNRLFINVHSLDMADTLADAHDKLLAIRTIDALLARFAEIVGKSAGTDHVWIYLFEQDALVRYYPPPGPGGAPPRLSGDHPLVRALDGNPQPFTVDALRRRRVTPANAALTASLDRLQVQLVAPICVERRLLGVLLLGRRLSGRFYSVDDQKALSLLCGELGLAIENSRLYTEVANARVYNDILLNALGNGIVAIRTDGRITVCNREAIRILGDSPKTRVGCDRSVLPPVLSGILRQTLRSGRGVSDLDCEIPGGSDAGPIPVRVSSTLFSAHTGEVLGALAVLHDITVVRRLEDQVRRTDRLSSLGTLSAGMAHEIKNPLVSIKTFAQLLPERYGDASFRETFAPLIVREVRRIDGIVDRLLKFAAPASAKLAPTGLHQVLEDLFRLISQQLKTHHIEIVRHFEATNDVVDGDADLLSQTLLNFMLNAQQAMPDGGKIELTTRNVAADSSSAERFAQSGWIRLSIRDTGIGIAAEYLSRVFDPFFSTKSSGTGLGLSVSHGIIQEHNGTIDIESTPGEGTVVTLDLPLAGRGAG